MTTDAKSAYRLRLPGPTEVPARVLQATARPVLNHRGPEFARMLGQTADMLRPVMGTRNEIMVFASSGTGVMEAAVANAVMPGGQVLILTNGQWGGRFKSIATALGLGDGVEEMEVEWGDAVSGDAVRERLAAGGYAAVIAIHNESSTGAVSDLEAIGAAVAETDAILIVDSVSGLGGIEMRQDEWGVDILVSASQKALMCPPGLGIASVSDKGIDVTVGESMTGFIRRTDLSRDRAEQRSDRFAVGEKVDAVVTNVDKKTRKLTLSIKARETAEEKQAMADFGSSDSGASLGDILGAALAKRDGDD